MNPHVDIVVLTRNRTPINTDILDAIKRQTGIVGSVFQVVGRERASDANRYETIARARNQGKRISTANWVMFVDDDVVLHDDCVISLIYELERLPDWGAMAADYLGQSNPSGTGHVSMGATLFRREALAEIDFRHESNKCECRCCCEDLEFFGWRIGYLPSAHATHLKATPTIETGKSSSNSNEANQSTGVIMSAMNAAHFERFYQVFLKSLVATGNNYPVFVAGYGLSKQQIRRLAKRQEVAEVLNIPETRLCPGVLRVRDFQTFLSQLAPSDNVAWYDAGDVLFQSAIGSIWNIVTANPDKLLAVQEPKSYPENWAVSVWPTRIPNLQLRQSVFELISANPFYNSGFVASTVKTMSRYLSYAERFLTITQLWEEQPMDQLAFNCYIHQRPSEFMEIDEAWNYCLAFRGRGKIRRRERSDSDWHPDLAMIPRFLDSKGDTIRVVHGNANMLERSLRRWWRMVEQPDLV